MPAHHKVLLLDDDQTVLDLYREILARLPTRPEIQTASSGARAIALLENEAFTLLISDLNMPKMDGLQVLTIVRRKFPHLRTAVMTAVADEQFRARAYAMGIDLFLEKPSTNEEMKFFLDCIESLLGKEEATGFRGVQSKSLVDIIQLECLSQSSSTLKIVNGPRDGRIWIQNGEVIDAATEALSGEPAFQRILSWKTGNFEILPAEPKRTRTIFNSAQGLLLETAQALDEAHAKAGAAIDSPGSGGETRHETAASLLGDLARTGNVEFVLSVPIASGAGKTRSWGLENTAQVAAWLQESFSAFSELGERLHAGSLTGFEASGLQRRVAVVPKSEFYVCAGFKSTLSLQQVQEAMKKIVAKWAS